MLLKRQRNDTAQHADCDLYDFLKPSIGIEQMVRGRGCRLKSVEVQEVAKLVDDAHLAIWSGLDHVPETADERIFGYRQIPVFSAFAMPRQHADVAIG